MNTLQKKRFREVMKGIKMESWKKHLLKTTITLMIQVKKELGTADDKFFSSMNFKGKEAIMKDVLRYVISGGPKLVKKKPAVMKSGCAHKGCKNSSTCGDYCGIHCNCRKAK